ncbi:hypothetical protein IFE09_11420 [Streptomyces microflavus]|nr:hypothetical protein [Streptomyces microflavus]QQZ54165.1 hypothetical protein IFE09_11420 [Streptomyces microflavus]
MTNTPDPHSQGIAVLRAAAGRAAVQLAFAAGQTAKEDPDQAQKLMEAADDLRVALDRSVPTA